MSEEVFDHLAVRAGRRSVALDDALFHVGRRHDQLPVFPDAGGEAVPGVLGKIRRMRPAVHPDDAIGAPEAAGDRVGHELLRDRIENLQDAERRSGAAHQVLDRMRLRLTFRLREDRGVPGIGLLPIGVVQRQTGVVAKLRTRDAMRLVLVADHGPVARDIGADDRRRRIAWCGGRRARRRLLRQGARPDECRHHDDERPAFRDPVEPAIPASCGHRSRTVSGECRRSDMPASNTKRNRGTPQRLKGT